MQVRAYNSGECAYHPAIVSTEALHCLQRSSQQSSVLIFLTCVCTWCAGLYPAVLVWVWGDQLPYPSFTGALVVFFTPVLLPLFSPLLPSISPSSMTPHKQLSGRFRFAAKLVRCAAHKGLRPTLTFDCVGNRMLFFLLVYILIMHILLYACGECSVFIYPLGTQWKWDTLHGILQSFFKCAILGNKKMMMKQALICVTRALILWTWTLVGEWNGKLSAAGK